MRVVYTEVISEGAPQQTSAGASGMAYTVGEELVVYEENGEYYYFIEGVAKGGLAYETDDVGPFDSLEEALDDAYGYLAWVEEEARKEEEYLKR